MERSFNALAVVTVLALSATLVAQPTIPELAFRDQCAPAETPNDIHVGEVAGVGANSKGQIFVYTRTGHPYTTLGDNRTFSRGGSRLCASIRKTTCGRSMWRPI